MSETAAAARSNRREETVDSPVAWGPADVPHAATGWIHASVSSLMWGEH